MMISTPQGPSANEHATLLVKLALVLLLTTCSVSVAVAQMKNCECEFDTKDYEAYGTNGACGFFMYKRAHVCEISFSGAGVNAKVLKETLGNTALRNQFAVAPLIFERYLAYESGGEKRPFLEPSFIETSLVVLARAAVFRESLASKKFPLKDIDSMFVDFSKRYSEKIAATFAGKAEPSEVKWSKGSVFSIGLGYVELNFEQTVTVRVVYFSEKPR